MVELTSNGMLVAAITSLSGVVAYLWRQQAKTHETTYINWLECMQDREELWQKAGDMSNQLKQIKEKLEN